jgi:hypothetical protein
MAVSQLRSTSTGRRGGVDRTLESSAAHISVVRLLIHHYYARVVPGTERLDSDGKYHDTCVLALNMDMGVHANRRRSLEMSLGRELRLADNVLYYIGNGVSPHPT